LSIKVARVINGHFQIGKFSNFQIDAMVIYEPNKNWMKDVVHLHRSWTLQKIVRAVMLMGLFTSIFCFVVLHFGLLEHVGTNTGVYSLLGVALSIVLVYRTNTAYERWWEGRKQWGALVNTCRDLAITVHGTFPREDEESRKFFAKHIANFCIALRDHLRTGVNVDDLILMQPEEKDHFRTKNHIPNHIVSLLFGRLQEAFKKGDITAEDILNLKPPITHLLDVMGACERIRKTPIPFSYAVYIKLFIMLYGAFLPFGLVQDFGYFTIPIVMIVFFAFIGLEMMAAEIEDPFGLDCNDLPTGDIAHNIKNNVFEILETRKPVAEEPSKELYQKVF
jgi:putative membrane protein